MNRLKQKPFVQQNTCFHKHDTTLEEKTNLDFEVDAAHSSSQACNAEVFFVLFCISYTNCRDSVSAVHAAAAVDDVVVVVLAVVVVVQGSADTETP